MKATTLFVLMAALATLLPPLGASAGDGGDIKAQHQDAVLKYLDGISAGIELHGTILRNETTGSFEAFHYDGDWLVRQEFGPIEWLGYTGAEGSWSGSNYGLPYLVEPQDSPANAVMELLTAGTYLDEPYWEHFNYVGEDAGGFNFTFTPPDLPPVDVVLYSDPEEPDYLQVMSLSIKLAPHDDKCVLYRAYYYYEPDEAGHLLTTKETGHEIDPNGATINFVEYTIDETLWPEERPSGMEFDFERKPFSKSAAALTAPVTVTARTDTGYFMLPLTFTGSEETFWFILDTGASSSLFSPEAATAAGLEPVITLPTYGHGSSVNFTLGMCNTAALGEAGGGTAPLDSFIATSVPEGNELLAVFATYGASGLLGIAPLHQYVTTFDQPDGTLTFTPPQLFDPAQVINEHTYVIDLDAEDLVYCPALINDTLAGEVVIDTGLALPQDLALLRETMEYNEVEMTTVGEHNSTVVGGERSFEYVSIPSFEILAAEIPENHGPLRMQGTMASLSEDDHGTLSGRGLLGFIGMTMFLDVKVTMDLFAQKLYYEVPAHMTRTDLAEDGGREEVLEWPPDADEEGGTDEPETNLPVDIS